MTKSLCVVVACVLLCSCIRSPFALAASSKLIAPGSYTELGPVEEKDCIYYLFGLIPITGGNDAQAALNDATKSRGGDALIQVTGETYYQNFIVVSRYCTIVQGIVVRTTTQASYSPVTPPPAR